MIRFSLNGRKEEYRGEATRTLLEFLRLEQGLTSVKDGCSGQAACGACLVEVGGRPALACSTPMKRLDGKAVVTIDGFPEEVRLVLARVFVSKGAVQCGFCTPGLITRAKLLLETNPDPTRAEVVKALRPHLCRCTGYVKIIEAILEAASILRNGGEIGLEAGGGVGSSVPKADGLDKALGKDPFINDMEFEGLLHGALRFSDHPRALIRGIDASAAEGMPGVIRVFTAQDIPGERYQGLIVKDWPMMVALGEETRCIGDVLAGVVAETEALARAAAAAIEVDYEVLEPLTEMDAAADSEILVHPGGNLLTETIIRRGEPIGSVFERAAHLVEGSFETPFVEHAFLETESSVAEPDNQGGLRVFSQSQGIFQDQSQIASLLNLPEAGIEVVQVPTGGGFGGKEDLSVQHHAALFSLILDRPVRVSLSRPESIRMHPKRHRMKLDYALAADNEGHLIGLRAKIIGDTGAYGSVGGEVVARTGTHAGGPYFIPNVDVEARAYYTHNPPAGAFRGFGVNQAAFALESMIDELCLAGGFDPWRFRYENALDNGLSTTTGHILGLGVGIKPCLEAVRPDYDQAKAEGSAVGLACALKNCGIGNGLEEISETRLVIEGPDRITLYHGWTEMGQGINTVARQILSEVAGLDSSVGVEVRCTTSGRAMGGVTTASRGTALLGNSIIRAGEKLKADLEKNSLADLVGREYQGRCVVDWTTEHAQEGRVISHFSYGYAAHLAILNKAGAVREIVAAHDAGRIINPSLFEGQIEGGVVMGLGYALSEKLELDKGRLVTDRLSRLGLPRAKDVPRIKVIGIEESDPEGPYGAKGVGEIGTIPTAPAVANAYRQFDGRRRFKLPLEPIKKD